MKYLIRCTDSLEELYWSNELGWTSRSEATIFDETDRKYGALPIDGEWEIYPER